ncbi:MAG: hypothetical protein MUP70_01650, partial [Candidatus Aminicenantes bacterium]|nr:hypothetical protein [Candidatus Aminicenantes bacterium]
MTLREIAHYIQTIRIPVDGVPVEETAAIELQKWGGISAEIVRSTNTAGNVGSQTASLSVYRPEFRLFLEKIGIRLPEREWVLCRIEDNGSFLLLSS